MASPDSAKETTDKIAALTGIPSTIAAPLILAAYPTAGLSLWGLGTLAAIHGINSAFDYKPPMQQGDNGDYFGANGERTKIDEMAGRVTGDNQWSY